MGGALFRQDKSRAHLDARRTHHQQVRHHAAGGNSSGDEHRDMVDLEEDLLDQDGQSYRPMWPPASEPSSISASAPRSSGSWPADLLKRNRWSGTASA
jgi:hypothetical protein